MIIGPHGEIIKDPTPTDTPTPTEAPTGGTTPDTGSTPTGDNPPIEPIYTGANSDLKNVLFELTVALSTITRIVRNLSEMDTHSDRVLLDSAYETLSYLRERINAL